MNESPKLFCGTEPESFELLTQHGTEALEAGRNEDAADFFRRAVQIAPESAISFCKLGRALTILGRLDAAIAACRQAISGQPKLAEAHNHLGVALGAHGRLEEAVSALRQAVRLQPDYAEAYKNLGIAFRMMGRLEEAVNAYRKVIQITPADSDAQNDMGSALDLLGRFDEAAVAFRKATQLKPDDAELYKNLSIALGRRGHFDEAIEACRRAVDLNPHNSDAHCNLGNAFGQMEHLEQAQAAYRRALELDPQNALAKFNSSTLYLLSGEFERGWPLYEERWNVRDFTSPRRNLTQPAWDGSPLAGRTLLIHEEQGLGDSIQFIRYVPLLAEAGGPVIVECPHPLLDVFSTISGIGSLVPAGDPFPHFDLHIPLMSLPLAFGTTLETIPQNVPYIAAPLARCDFWREWLAVDSSRLKVGFAWAGNPAHPADWKRSMQLRQFLPLFHTQDVEFISLQMDSRSAQIRQLPGKQHIRDASEFVSDFADTAALVSQLDLVITVDTSIAHLAGALGRPVWVLLPFAPDWRWLLDRSDSPWYPSMRIFRQERLGEWEPVIAQVRRELKTLAPA